MIFLARLSFLLIDEGFGSKKHIIFIKLILLIISNIVLVLATQSLYFLFNRLSFFIDQQQIIRVDNLGTYKM